MSWFKTLTCYLVVAQMLLAPVLAHAEQKPEVVTQITSMSFRADGTSSSTGQNVLTEEGKQRVQSLTKYANNLGYDSRTDLQNKKVLLINRDTKKVEIEIPLTDEKTLKGYSPKTLGQKLSAEMRKVKTAGSAAWSQTVRGLPVESALFFIALGGMVAMDLMTNYANNPVAMQQHIEHSLSPVGTLGFGMFMLGQGVTSNVMSIWLRNPKLQMPIGMLGMTVGFAMQTYFSQVMMDPHLRACAASIFKGEKIEGNDHPCEGAYKYLVLDKKIFTGPTVTALLGSFALGVAAKAAIGKTLRMVGFNIAMWIAPGGAAMKVVQVAIKVADMVAFTAIQMEMEHMMTYPWKNYWDGKDFVDINDRIVAYIEAQKKSQWSTKPTEMIAELKKFNEKMADWRLNNISEAYMAHQGWEALLKQLTSVYNQSYNFYSTYTSNLLNTEGSKIDRAYPLNGVTPYGLEPGHEDLYVLAPQRVELLQKMTVAEVATEITKKLDEGYYASQGFNQEQLTAVSQIRTGLTSDDLNTIGRALYNLTVLISKNTRNAVGSPRFASELTQIYYKLGKPEPMFEAGRGYAASMMLSPSTLQNIGAAPVDKVNGRFSTPTSADYFVVQMMCGPEVASGEKVVSVTKGFPAKFNPPALALDNGDKDNLCLGASTTPWENWRIYNLPFSKQKTAPDYIRANIDPEAAKDFAAWWAKGSDAQMREAFKTFSISYKEIVKKLMEGLDRSERSTWNRGFISNGSLRANMQEISVYLIILGELLKDTYKAQYKTDLPAEYFSKDVDTKIGVDKRDNTLSYKPLLSRLGSNRYDFNTLISANPNADVRSLKIQKQVGAKVFAIHSLIREAASSRGSQVNTTAVNEALSALAAQIKAFGGLLGVQPDEQNPEASEGTDATLVTLSEDQKALAVTCLELLQEAANELGMYGNMVLTASYPEPKTN